MNITIRRVAVWLIAVVATLAVSQSRPAAAADLGNFSPEARSVAPSRTEQPSRGEPRRLDHGSVTPQPLNPQPFNPAPEPSADEPPVADRYAERNPATSGHAFGENERLASDDEPLRPAQTSAPATILEQAADPRRPIPLAAPSSDDSSPLKTDKLPGLATGAASLGIVLGLFLLVVWVARRGMPNQGAMLPSEALEVLGRAPLVGRQQVHLVRAGNKLLFVCLTPTGAQTLTEITDPLEVERLVALCQPGGGSAFRQIFQQFATPQRDRRFLARDQAADMDLAHLEALHHAVDDRRA